MPETEIYSFLLTNDGDTSFLISDPQYHSAFNIAGYNNQPSPTADGYLMTVAGNSHDQTDIYQIHTGRRQIEAVTSTLMYSEYSPMLDVDNKEIYCVRVDSQGNQNLWAYPEDRSHRGYNVLPGQNKVGYYEFIGMDSVALFITGEPHQLIIYNRDSMDQYVVDSDVGRCLSFHDDQLYYVKKQNPDNWVLMRFIPVLNRSTDVSPLPIDVEDFLITSNGSILIGYGAKILLLDRDNMWKEIVELSKYGLNEITRLAEVKNRLICVNKVEK
jgi:hypothetical protein